MENTILVGDKIVLDKLTYGPKLPTSPHEIPWINLLFLTEGLKDNMDSIWWPPKKLPGISNVNRGDILVFRHPWKDQIFIKRCIGLPGDTIKIIGGRVFVNSAPREESPDIKLNYHIWYNDLSQLNMALKNLYIESQKQVNENYLPISLSHDDIISLQDYHCIDSITLSPTSIDTLGLNFSQNRNWPEDCFGPYIVPFRGFTVQLDTNTFSLYGRVINNGEQLNDRINKVGDQIYLGDSIEISNYSFNNNYYFVLGDNRPLSSDSRYWGSLPEQNIIGKASFVLFSNNQNGVKWDRIFKSLN